MIRSPRRRRTLPARAAALALLLLPAGGCRTGKAPEQAMPDVRLDLACEATEVAVGEPVRLSVAGTEELPGTPDLHWIASGGQLAPPRDPRIAEVRFDEPGEYRVSVTLFVHDRIADTRTIAITVRPGP